jgi:hypothetical protein
MAVSLRDYEDDLDWRENHANPPALSPFHAELLVQLLAILTAAACLFSMARELNQP